ncbi:hypothetical protein vseg_006225 [Gypsophila vaccaria]
MEYLSRILHLVGDSEDFRFHPKCKALKLNHLCFADDLVMFCTGHLPSMKLMISGFLAFSAASGLVMNSEKSEGFFNGIPQDKVMEFLLCLGFKQGHLPFKYLGVPISPNRLSVMECHKLVELMVARIRGWSSRRLSYAGWVTLVKSVLMALHTYWAQIFLLPMIVLKEVEAICRNYLWEGHEHYTKSPPVAWSEVCKSKKTGGLGLRDIKAWNVAAVGKLAWWITCKADHLWVKWVHQVYLRGHDWFSYKPTQDSTWGWRKICSTRDALSPGQLWYGSDYSIQKGYQWLNGSHTKVNWSQVIWNRYSLPKHSFITWLGAKNRLQTRQRLSSIGVCTVTDCFLCSSGEDSVEHLFFVASSVLSVCN